MVRRGVSAVGCLVYLLVIAAGTYLGGGFATAYIDYFRFRDAMKQEAKFTQQRTDEEIQSRLRLMADSLGLPRTASMVRVIRGPGRAKITGSYQQSIPVPLIGPRSIRFNPVAEVKF